ncbi:MAG: tripartite tricarboxylate transporter substrate-binding protein [Oscillospiraceae bacterium]|nr:tripartite tricarboxylate transporter substrate-binding protein [Oscillospiraceae bacterium]
MAKEEKVKKKTKSEGTKSAKKPAKSKETTNAHFFAKIKSFVQEHKKLSIISGAGILLILVATLMFVFMPGLSDNLNDWFDDTVRGYEPTELQSVVVPWNPGGTADLTARALLNQAAPEVNIHNIHGALGANGLNEVFETVTGGERVLCTSLSSMVVANLTGFTRTTHEDWEYWFAAYSPSVIAVRADSPFFTLEELITVATSQTLTCANAGNGSLGFVAAHLFESGAGISVAHVAFSGTNPAVSAVRVGEADFIIALSSELAGVLRGGEFRALATLSDEVVTLDGVGEIRPAHETVAGLAAIAPFGEWFGMMLPHDTPSRALRDYDRMWSDAAASNGFGAFTVERGMVRIEVDRAASAATAERIARLIKQTFLNTGYIKE